jgi:hypothetical protein
MNEIYLKITGILLVSEIIFAFVFSAVSQVFYKKLGLDFRSIFKGMLERFFLLIALYNEYPHALTFFSAIKLATRLKHEEAKETNDRFNDFYLIGNLISVTLSIFYVMFVKWMLD